MRSAHRNSLLIVIPVYNCAVQINRVLSGLLHEAEFLKKTGTEVIVIDNQSADGTPVAVIEHFSQNAWPCKTRFLQNSVNLGLGGSQKRAFQIAKDEDFEFVAILHGDDQASASDLNPLFARMDSEVELAAVLGSRFSSGSSLIGYSRIRTIGNTGLNIVYSVATGRKIEDLGSGLNIFRCSKFEIAQVMAFSDHFTFNMDLLLHLVRRQRRFVFLPITWTELDQVSNARNMNVGLEALRTLVKWKFGPDATILINHTK